MAAIGRNAEVEETINRERRNKDAIGPQRHVIKNQSEKKHEREERGKSAAHIHSRPRRHMAWIKDYVVVAFPTSVVVVTIIHQQASVSRGEASDWSALKQRTDFFIFLLLQRRRFSTTGNRHGLVDSSILTI